jgi:hypothetical protein
MARLRPQPTQKLSKGDVNLLFHFGPWGITMISLEKD